MAPLTAANQARDAVLGGTVTPQPSGTTASASAEPAAPAVDVRIVLFTIADGRLVLYLRGTDHGDRLPGGEPLLGESLDADARRLLRAETGGREEYLEQLYTLGVTTSCYWRVIVTYLGLAKTDGAAPPPSSGSWHDLDALPSISESDRLLVDYGARRLRAKLGYTTIAFHLLPATFTLSELQTAYEAVLGSTLDKRNFRRRVLAADFLAATSEKRRVGSHRPALLYRFRAVHDHESYLTPTWAEGA